MFAAGLEAPGWLPVSEKKTQVYLLYQPVVEGRILGTLTRWMATSKSWPVVVLRAKGLLLGAGSRGCRMGSFEGRGEADDHHLPASSHPSALA